MQTYRQHPNSLWGLQGCCCCLKPPSHICCLPFSQLRFQPPPAIMHDTHAISDQAQPKPQSHIGMVGPPQPPHSIQTRHDSKQPAAAASGPAKPTQSCQPPPCNHSTPCAAAAPHWRGRPTTCCCCLPCPTQRCQPPPCSHITPCAAAEPHWRGSLTTAPTVLLQN